MGFYQIAGNALKSVLQGKTSLVGGSIGNSKVPQQLKRRMYAALCQTIQKAKMLLYIIDKSQILSGQHKIKDADVLVILHDFLFARGGIAHDSDDPVLKKLIFYHKNKLFKLMKSSKADPNLAPIVQKKHYVPRYVRVNTLKISVKQTISSFEDQGYKYIGVVKYTDFESKLQHKSKKFGSDEILPDVLVFPSGTDLISHSLYKSGDIVLQDKASCFPAFILSPEPESTVIDACAAPGNKTSHLASVMNNKGKIFAYDLDNYRLETLIKQTNLAGCKCIEARNSSFLDIDPNSKESTSIDYILLDPSCSGSGIVSRSNDLIDSFIAAYTDSRKYDYSVEIMGQIKPNSRTRLQNLSKFQTNMLLHAMKFPNVKKITYSTCSIHFEENEKVVENVLSSQNEFKLAAPQLVIPQWPKRGEEVEGQGESKDKDEVIAPSNRKKDKNSLSKEEMQSLVRSSAEEMYTNGFFVACFVNVSKYPETEYILNKHRKVSVVEPDTSLLLGKEFSAEAGTADADAIAGTRTDVSAGGSAYGGPKPKSNPKSKSKANSNTHADIGANSATQVGQSNRKNQVKGKGTGKNTSSSNINSQNKVEGQHSEENSISAGNTQKRKTEDSSSANKHRNKRRLRTPITKS